MAEIAGANLIGSNVVYDTRGSVGAYNAQLQKQAAQRAAEQKALNDDINKIKVDGLREADMPDYFKGFDDWRSTAQAAVQEKDWKKKALLQSEADRKSLKLESLIKQSKEYGRLHYDVSNKFLDDRFRNQYNPDAVTLWQQSRNIPLSDPRLIRDPSTLARQINTSKVLDSLTNIDEDLLKRARYSNPATRRVQSGNKSGTESIYSRTVDPKEQALNYGMAYDTNKDNFKSYVQKQYADVFDKLPEDEAKAFAIQDIVKQRPVVRQETPKMDWDRAPARISIRTGGDEVIVGGGGTDLVVPFGKDPNSNVVMKGAIKMPTANLNFAGSPAIDLSTGKAVDKKLPSSNDYQIVTVSNIPFIRKDAKGVRKDLLGSVSQPNYADQNPDKVEERPMIHVQYKTPAGSVKNYLIPFDRMPENLSKQNRALLSTFVPSTGIRRIEQSSTPTKSTGKKVIKGF